MIISTNIAALNTVNQLNRKQTKLSKTTEKLSSGVRINRSADDAAGLSISEKMRAQIRGLAQASRNAQDGISLIQTAEGALSEVHEMLQRMRELAVQSANGTYTDDDRATIDKEVQQLKHAVDNIANETEFNTIKLLKNENKVEQVTTTVPVTTYKPTVTVENKNMEVPDIGALDPADKQNIKADVVFVIDHTGSMGQSIANVKDNIEKFLEHFDGTDVQIGLVTYSDSQIVSYDLGMTTQNFKDVLASLPLMGGWEYALEAIQDHAVPMSFRDDAAKHMILVTDESGDVRGGHTPESVRNALDAKGITLNTVAPVSLHGGYSSIISGKGKQADLNSSVFREVLYDLLNNIVEDSLGTTNIPKKTVNEEVEVITYEEVTSQETRVLETENPLLLQVGANAGQTLHIRLCDARIPSLGLSSSTIATQASANQAISAIDRAIGTVSSYRSRFGAYQNRLEHTIRNLNNAEENLQASRSQIADADMAYEIVEQIKTNVLLQSGQAMLAHANSIPNSVLQLLN